MKSVSRAMGMAAIILMLGAWGAASAQTPAKSVSKLFKPKTLTFHPPIGAHMLKILQGTNETEVSSGKQSFTLKQGQLAVGKLTEPARRTVSGSGRTGWTLPYKISGVGMEGQELHLEPQIEIDGGGFRPGGGGAVARGFFARVFMAIKDVNNPTASEPVDPPISMLVTADVDELTPRNVELGTTNQFVEVRLRVVSPREPVRMRIVPSFDPQGSEIDLAVLRGALRISVSPPTIQGFGLETASITMTSSGLPEPKGTAVALTTTRGSLDGTTFELNDAGVASSTIRSISAGTATLSAEADGVGAGTATVTFVMPWLFLGAALIGGAAGALVRRGKARGKGEKRRHLGLEMGLGVVAGVIVAAAYAIGINLLEVRPAATAGEALVFVLAALGGLFGIPERA